MPANNLGTLLRPGPNLGEMAWQRRGEGQDAGVSLCGLTHSLSAVPVMEWLGANMTAPVYDWDAISCTSAAGRSVVTKVFDEWEAHLAERLGVKRTRAMRPQLPIIPLGVEAGAFDPGTDKAAEARRRWRQRLGLAEDTVMVLFFGRLSYYEKANPVPMYLALEEAAAQCGARLHLVQAGRFPEAEHETLYRNAAATFMPAVPMTLVDGADADVDALWHAADVFVSLSDNVQETFGITVIEAMAAGLPVVVSDWDGYMDTVADNEVGMRIPTLWPPAGEGVMLGVEHFLVQNYHAAIGRLSQITAVDVAAAAAALARLADDPGLRRRMGAAGRQRVLNLFDWPVVVAGWQALFADLRARREAAQPRFKVTRHLPQAADPLKVFGDFPTSGVADGTPVRAASDWRARLSRALADPLARANAPAVDGLEAITAALEAGAGQVGDLTGSGDRIALRQLVLWLAKMGVVSLG
jgi:glycosyltransferase involved in cell wall biosynthesis